MTRNRNGYMTPEFWVMTHHFLRVLRETLGTFPKASEASGSNSENGSLRATSREGTARQSKLSRRLGSETSQGGPKMVAQLFKTDLLTFWFSRFGPFLVEVPKG